MVTSFEDMLSKTVLFQNLDRKALQGIAGYCVERDFGKGQVITRQGELGTGLFIIVSGSVDVVHNRGEAGERLIATLSAGDFFGEMALFLERPRTATIVAREPTRCLTLVRWDFKDRALEAPAVLWNMLEVLAARLAGADQQILSH